MLFFLLHNISIDSFYEMRTAVTHMSVKEVQENWPTSLLKLMYFVAHKLLTLQFYFQYVIVQIIQRFFQTFLIQNFFLREKVSN